MGTSVTNMVIFEYLDVYRHFWFMIYCIHCMYSIYIKVLTCHPNSKNEGTVSSGYMYMSTCSGFSYNNDTGTVTDNTVSRFLYCLYIDWNFTIRPPQHRCCCLRHLLSNLQLTNVRDKKTSGYQITDENKLETMLSQNCC